MPPAPPPPPSPGMSSAPSEARQAVRELVRDFAEPEIRPIAAAIDESHDFPAATVNKMGELGLMGMFVPEAYGGAGMDYLSYALALQELSRACPSHGAIASAPHSLVCYPLPTHGGEAHKRE